MAAGRLPERDAGLAVVMPLVAVPRRQHRLPSRYAGMTYSAWIAQTARKEFTIQAGLEAVSQYEAEHGPFTPDEITEADEWATRITQLPAAGRTA
jgi:hypothetical protein